ncbi:phage minor head protein [Pusillimonas sp. ANT_WB101]|uniref:phage minor head protein n=1 Tax=Pusillimonas sp. ANT_WB101 TaxID=2597356 RepID=UPI0011EBE287|nr:phage minor head protein [Pusillimonas sp. ANT_WB101]KAA0910676.1 phage head morphogenesis protein [Pusillimonas sp. ANT_WB101]
MARKPSPPILPGNWADPTGIDRLERGAIRELARRVRKIGRAYKAALERIPVEPTVNRKYVFALDSFLLRSILDGLDAVVDAILLEGGEDRLWFLRQYVEVATVRGTAQEFANLSQQSPAYKAGRESLQEILRSAPYRRRMALTQARTFEEMKGLAAKVKASMNRVLTEGIGRGQNPREIARNLTSQAGIEAKRARLIARTEVPMALRQARWDESEDAQDAFGLVMKEMHLSALSSTTRVSHAARHAKLFTVDEVREWYSQDGNLFNCKCSQVSVMVDDNGKPIVPAIVERAKQAKQKMEERGYGWAKD